jgi:hypothetical protein
VLHNSAPCTVTLNLSASQQVDAPPSSSQPFDWGGGRSPPRRATLLATLPGDTAVWQSELFSLKESEPKTVTLSALSGGPKGTRGKPTVLSNIFLTLSVNLASSGDPDSAGGDHKTLHVIISPALAVSNLSPWVLRVTPEGGAEPIMPLEAAPGSSQAPVPAWKPCAVPNGKIGNERLSAHALRIELEDMSSEGLANGKGLPGVVVPLRRHRGRTCQLRGKHREVVTARILISKGRRHVVLFQDPQPPLRFLNRTPEALEVRTCQLLKFFSLLVSFSSH